jgi:lambda repressor-like predicted transcriptional regulator
LENEQLRTAITRAGLSLDELADIVQVDVKTVRRWLEGRTPYPRHRTRVASALETTAHALWPAAVPAPAPSDALEPTTHDPGDVVAGYAYSSDPVAPKPVALLGAAVEQIQILIPNLASQPELVALLRARAGDGCRINIIIEEPDARIEPLLDIDAIDVRASPARAAHILYRTDDQILLALRHISFPEQSPPLIHLRQASYGGLFDRLLDDFDDRWDKATPLASSPQRNAHLADVDADPWTEPAQLPEPDSPSPGTPSRPSEAPTASPGEAPRRWPRRPT